MADATATADLKNTRTATQNHTGLLARLGPGLITGAADDDPSGIATYSQVGAQFGYGMLWTMLFTFPLMAAIQEICARLGRITGRGVAANLRENYPRSVLLGLVLLLCSANIFNIGADVSAMGACAQLVAVNAPFEKLALPAVPTAPTSPSIHPDCGCVPTTNDTALLLFIVGATATAK